MSAMSATPNRVDRRELGIPSLAACRMDSALRTLELSRRSWSGSSPMRSKSSSSSASSSAWRSARSRFFWRRRCRRSSSSSSSSSTMKPSRTWKIVSGRVGRPGFLGIARDSPVARPLRHRHRPPPRSSLRTAGIFRWLASSSLHRCRRQSLPPRCSRGPQCHRPGPT
jgi:hypothetical protein